MYLRLNARKEHRKCHLCHLRKHLTAQILVAGITLSTVAVPASALAPSSEYSGILSLILRVLERRNLRLEEASHASSPEEPPSETTEEMLNRAAERRMERLEDESEPAAETESALSAEELLRNEEERRSLREAELEESETPEEPSEEYDRLAERRALRERRAEEAEKREQYSVLREAMFDAVNRERAAKNLPPLTYNADLELSAQLHAEDMFIREYFDHFSPEGLSYIDRIKNTGYGNVDYGTCNCSSFKVKVGENLAKGQRSVNWAINELMASLSHRKAILSTEFMEIGVGISDNIWVQNFGGIEYTPR